MHYYCELSDKLGQVVDKNEEISDQIDSLEDRMCILENKLKRSETLNRRLSDQVTDLQTRSMKENIIFSFDKDSDFGRSLGKEADGENCSDIVRQFLCRVMGVSNVDTLYITVAHRIGTKNPNYPRSIIAKFPIAKEIELVMRHANRLRDTNHRISKQIPASVRERTQFAWSDFKDKKKNPANNARLDNGKMYVKGRLQQQYLPPVLPAISTDDEDIPTFNIAASNPITEKGSTFTGYAAEVKSMDDVSVVLDQTLMIDGAADANHRIYAYSINQGRTIVENFDSDGDHGIGLELLRKMQEGSVSNKIWITTRKCHSDFSHIGNKRFDHAKAVCAEASAALT